MAITQLRGFLKQRFDVEVEEAELFDEDCTLAIILGKLGVDEPNGEGVEAADAEAPAAAAETPAGRQLNQSTTKTVFCWCCPK